MGGNADCMFAAQHAVTSIKVAPDTKRQRVCIAAECCLVKFSVCASCSQVPVCGTPRDVSELLLELVSKDHTKQPDFGSV